VKKTAAGTQGNLAALKENLEKTLNKNEGSVKYYYTSSSL